MKLIGWSYEAKDFVADTWYVVKGTFLCSLSLHDWTIDYENPRIVKLVCNRIGCPAGKYIVKEQ
jgi:hypothetical protein